MKNIKIIKNQEADKWFLRNIRSYNNDSFDEVYRRDKRDHIQQRESVNGTSSQEMRGPGTPWRSDRQRRFPERLSYN